jgi:hypothetical protein
MNRIKKTISGRVDINNLLDRARKKKQKINKKKINYLWFVYCPYHSFGNFFIFLKKDILWIINYKFIDPKNFSFTC